MRLSAEEYKKSRVEVKATIDRNDVGFAILYFRCLYPSDFKMNPRYWCKESDESKRKRKARSVEGTKFY